MLAFPLPDWTSIKLATDNLRSPPDKQTTGVRDSTEQGERSTDGNVKSGARIEFAAVEDAFKFRYFAGRETFEDGRKVFEITGGGGGILDYDCDGWPDVFLAQGRDLSSIPSDVRHGDRICRNLRTAGLASHRFHDVSQLAGIYESAFGQGVAIGDVNVDGFDDIYVCNLGANQLWINQGDGAFRDGSRLMPLGDSSWTVSAAIADLNDDGLPERYDANYCTGGNVFSQRCEIGGRMRACGPLNFARAPGRLLTVTATGALIDVTADSLDPAVQTGYALGLAVFRTKGQPQNCIFIGNDQVANHWLSPVEDPSAPLGLRLVDQATLNGLAFDGAGYSQACMGIAVGDVDQDGSLDLLVSNYYDESNTFYQQLANGAFVDRSKPAGLYVPSLKVLGFGAQFIDAQSDGVDDLIVLNGHIDDMTHVGIPFRMKPQFFVGQGQTKFTELNSKSLGGFFDREASGRALSIIDFECDGRQDLIATDLSAPTNLIHNTTPSGRYLSLQLVGTQSHRDAIGSEVVVTVGEQTWTRQLVGGSGYMASNERLLHFGLGDVLMVDRLEITWPSGRVQSNQNLPTNSTWLAVENDSELFVRIH